MMALLMRPFQSLCKLKKTNVRYVELTIGAEPLLKALPLDCIIQQFLSMSINIRI